VATSAGRSIVPQGIQGPPSEREFVRALRRRAFNYADIHEKTAVLGLTPMELETECGLSRPSVAGLIKRFEPVLQPQDLDGRVLDAPDSARRWALDPSAGVAVGVAIGQDRSRVLLSDLYGRSNGVEELTAGRSADDTIDEAVEQIRALLGDRPATDVVGVGISLAAPVETEKGVSRHVRATANGSGPSPWADWQMMTVRDHLRARLDWDTVPVALDNDANVSALAEYIWGAARPPRTGDRPPYNNVVFVEWSRGIGAGLMLGGRQYRGQGVAGEIGHTVVVEGKEAAQCDQCGNYGCLQTVAGWQAVLQSIHASESGRALEHEDLIDALDAAREPDGRAARAFEQAAWHVGRALGPIIHVLNPEMVIIGGDIGTSGYQVVKSPLLASLRRFTMRPALVDVTVLPGKLLNCASLHGSAALVLQESSGLADPLLAHLQRRSR